MIEQISANTDLSILFFYKSYFKIIINDKYDIISMTIQARQI